MTISPTYLYLLILANAFLAALLVVVIQMQTGLIKTIGTLKKKTRQLGEQMTSKESAWHDQARQEAHAVVKAAIKRADAIEKEALANKEKWQKMTNQSLNNLVAAHQQEVVKILKNISKDIEKEALSGLEADLKRLRQQRLRRLDEEIFGLVARVSEVVLGQSLDAKKHQELVAAALARAKKEL